MPARAASISGSTSVDVRVGHLEVEAVRRPLGRDVPLRARGVERERPSPARPRTPPCPRRRRSRRTRAGTATRRTPRSSPASSTPGRPSRGAPGASPAGRSGREPSQSWRPTQPGAPSGRQVGRHRAAAPHTLAPCARGSSGSCCWQPWSASAADSSRAGASGSCASRRRLPAAPPPRCRPPRRASRSTRRRPWRRTPTTSTTRHCQPGLHVRAAADGELRAGLGGAVPEGLAGLHGAAARSRSRRKERSTYDELRFRPPDEPTRAATACG